MHFTRQEQIIYYKCLWEWVSMELEIKLLVAIGTTIDSNVNQELRLRNNQRSVWKCVFQFNKQSPAAAAVVTDQEVGVKYIQRGVKHRDSCGKFLENSFTSSSVQV